jgi:hypothetical protein
MSTRNRIRMAAGTAYVVALIIGIFTGNFLWIAVGGAILLAMVTTALRGGGLMGLPEGGRQRNRNRGRDRGRG